MANRKVKITQIKSAIGYRCQAKDTLKALGIKRMNGSVVKNITPAIQGMLDSIKHLLIVEDIK